MSNGMATLCNLPNKVQQKQLKLAGFICILSSICTLLPMLGLYYIFHALFMGNKTGAYLGVGVALVGIFLQFVLSFISLKIAHLSAYNTMNDIRKTFLKKLLRLPQGFLTQHSSGKLKSQIFDDVEKLELFYGHHYPEIIGNLTTPLLMIILVFFMDWCIGLAMLLPIIIYIMCLGAMGKIAMKNYPLMESSTQNLNNYLVEYVHGMKEIRLFATTGKTWKNFENASENYTSFMQKWFRDCRGAMTINSIIMSSGIIFVFPVAGYFYVHGQISISEFVFYLFASLCYALPLIKIANCGDEMSICIQIATRLETILNAKELSQVSETQELKNFDVVFDKVTFSYQNDDSNTENAQAENTEAENNKIEETEVQNTKITKQNCFENLSFTAPMGKVTALVGPSGGGKSTVLKLLARFWDIQEGSISIGGVDLRSLSAEQLANNIAFVSQKTDIFEKSIYENILLGKPSANKEDVEEVAKLAQCHDFIMSLPQGYDTIVGRAYPLSGGERQRITIARALLKNAPILLLDEATANCDAENEEALQKSLSQLIKGKTVFVIAHRLQSIMSADIILVLDEGKIIHSGTHSELLANSPLYQKMWKAFESSETWLAGGKNND